MSGVSIGAERLAPAHRGCGFWAKGGDVMRLRIVGPLAAMVLFANTASTQDGDRFWPQWRGPSGDGVAPHADPPTEWSEDTNIRWKKPLPGRGSSTPVLWGDRLYVTTAVPFGKDHSPTATPSQGRGGGPPITAATRSHRFLVLAIDRATGETVWETSVREELPHEGTHEFGNFASASPITDGERIWAFFGSRGLYCLDLDGKIIWEKDFGDMRTLLSFGEGASPVLHGDMIVVP